MFRRQVRGRVDFEDPHYAGACAPALIAGLLALARDLADVSQDVSSRGVHHPLHVDRRSCRIRRPDFQARSASNLKQGSGLQQFSSK
jgi:hypothetical protein